MTEASKSQLEKFKPAARELGTDDAAPFDERMAKLVQHKPLPEKPE